MHTLFINACVRPESRTKALADRLLAQLPGTFDVLNLEFEGIEPLNDSRLLLRDDILAAGDLDHPMLEYARQFAQADMIVIAAPYWDLSFPALLKTYIEAINVNGITFRYSEEGIPMSLCRAKRAVYLTTAGGPIVSDEYGFGYIKGLFTLFFGIEDVAQVKVEGLDIIGANIDALLEGGRHGVDDYIASRSWE